MHEDAIVRELVMDSRKVAFPETSLFFALKGQRRDGHLFIEEAFKKGIRNFIISDKSATVPGAANVIAVKDVLEALQCLAAHHADCC